MSRVWPLDAHKCYAALCAENGVTDADVLAVMRRHWRHKPIVLLALSKRGITLSLEDACAIRQASRCFPTDMTVQQSIVAMLEFAATNSPMAISTSAVIPVLLESVCCYCPEAMWEEHVCRQVCAMIRVLDRGNTTVLVSDISSMIAESTDNDAVTRRLYQIVHLVGWYPFFRALSWWSMSTASVFLRVCVKP